MSTCSWSDVRPSSDERITRARWTAEQDRILIDMTRAGDGVPLIAAAIGRTPAAVYVRRAVLRRTGLDLRSPSGKAERDRILAAMISNDLSEHAWTAISEIVQQDLTVREAAAA